MHKVFSHKVTKVLSIFGLATCWIIGFFIVQNKEEKFLSAFLPSNQFHSEKLSDHLRKITDQHGNSSFLFIAKSKGYGGNVQVLLQADTSGIIQKADLGLHNETPSYLDKLENKKYLSKFNRKSLQSLDQLTSIDVISGATITSEAIRNSIIKAAEEYNTTILNNEPGQITPTGDIKFGLAELTILALLVMYFLGSKIKRFPKKKIRRIAGVLSLIVLGFIFNQSIGLSRLVALLAGWLPPYTVNLAFYLLLIGTLVIILFKKENFYCHWACPFGAIQDNIGALTNASKKINRDLVWIPKLLTWIALAIALLFRTPEMTDYTIFSALFDFTASDLIFSLLGISMVMSVFIHRPWCQYACPVGEVFNSLIRIRKSLF